MLLSIPIQFQIKQKITHHFPVHHTALPTCKGKADVAFLLDSSGSIKKHYQNEKNFLKTLAGAFELSKGGSQAGVITFSQHTEISMQLNQYHDITSFNEVGHEFQGAKI